MTGELLGLYATPDGSGARRLLTPDDLHPAEVRLWVLPDGVVEVHDPILNQPYRFGDRSLVTDPTADMLIVQNVQHYAAGLGTRQNNRAEDLEIAPGTGRVNRMGHMLTGAALAAWFRGSEREITAVAVHDDGHRRGSHWADALLSRPGSRVHHDADLVAFLGHSGFTERLVRLGLSDGTHLANGVAMADLEYHPDEPPSFTYRPKKADLEIDRLEYIAREAAVWIYGPDAVREILGYVARGEAGMPDIGDQLYFTDVEAATLFTTAQIRAYTEHWADQVALATDELQMVLARRLLTSTSTSTAVPDEYKQLHPADSLYTLEEDWQEAVRALAQKDPAVRGLLKIIHGLRDATHEAYEARLSSGEGYDGPTTPDWASIFVDAQPRSSAFYQHTYASGENFLVLAMDGGTQRELNPWVKPRRGEAQRIDDIARVGMAGYRKRHGQWAGRAYDVVIDLGDRKLGMTPREIRGVESAVSAKSARLWREALQRPQLDSAGLTARLARNAAHYWEIGAVLLEDDSSLAAVRQAGAL